MSFTISAEFKSELRQMYFGSQVFGAAADIAARGGDTPAECIQRAFDYIERSTTALQAWARTTEMFSEWDYSIDAVMEDLGGFNNCLIEGGK